MNNLSTDLIQELTECQIIPFSERIPNPPPLLEFGGKPIFTRGNISTIIGAPKSGKTMILSYFTAACMNPIKVHPGFKTDSKYPEILYYDTEQSPYHSKKCIERIYKILSGNHEEQNLKAFGLRNKNTFKRFELIEFGINQFPDTSLVIIDGIADLVESYNDEKQCSEITNKLMELSQEYNCHICTVIHINRSSKDPKGHLGAALSQKSENVFLVEKKGNNITLKTQASRDLELPDLNFKIDEIGIPILDSHISPPPKGG